VGGAGRRRVSLWRTERRLGQLAGVSWVLAAVALVHLAVVVVWGPIGPPGLMWLPAAPATFISAVACWMVGIRYDLPPATRRFWRQLAVGIVLVGVGGLFRTTRAFTATDITERQLQAPDMVIYSIGMIVVGYALCRLPLGLHNRGRWWTFSLDMCTVMVAAGLFTWFISTRAAMATEADSLGALGALVSIALTLVVVFALAKVALTGAATVDPFALRLLGLALLVGALAAIPEAALAVKGEITGTPVGTTLPAVLATLAARRQALAGRHTDKAAAERAGLRPYSLIPYVAVAATGLLLFLVIFSDDVAARVVVTCGALVVVTLVVLRQLTAFRDNAQLLTRLDASMVELADHERRFRSLVQHASDLITITGANGVLTYVSPAVERLLGAPAETWVGRAAANMVHEDDLRMVKAHYDAQLANPGMPVTYQVRLLRADGSYRWTEVTSVNLLHDPGVAGIVGNCRDITDAREFQQRLHHQASHDMLTGLANRGLFADRLTDALRGAVPRSVSVALMDLNDFKAVNDSLGHAAGDELLVVAAERLRRSVRTGDTVARLGGDEFAVLLADANDGVVDAVVARIIAAFSPPVQVSGSDLRLEASIGIAVNDGPVSASELQRRADVAMYAAKADRDRGGTRHTRYAADMEAPLAWRTRLEYDLRDAIDAGQLRLAYQPVVRIDDGRLLGAEALVRWDHPDLGTVMPNQFIPIAERTGLIVAVGRWVLREACHQAAAWLERHGNRAAGVSVNVSAGQLRQPDFAADVLTTLAATRLEPSRLTLELTETAALGGGSSVDNLDRLRATGVRIALDDFGTGQSSLSVLQGFTVDELKLDRSFTETLEGGGRTAVCAAVIQVGAALGLDVVAEGVESATQARRLVELGYSRAQGYHYGRPMTPADLEALIAGPDSADRLTETVPAP
jgi:diguanylate cyclase (GGDEF)-like protein/PAS domain S-box-containing protein